MAARLRPRRHLLVHRLLHRSCGNHPTIRRSFPMIDQPLPLLHLDDRLVAVAKPAGLLVHPSGLDAHAQHTALQLLRDQLGQWLWPLHRLDKATSGVLLFARSAEAAREWGLAFEQGRIAKRYLALVRGWPAEAGEIAQPLARDPELPS